MSAAQQKSSSSPTRWQSEALVFGVPQFIHRVEQAIAAAKRSIVLEMYILRADHTGQRVIQALLAAAQRGVHIRLIIDGFGSRAWHAKALLNLIQQGVFIRVFHPLPRPFHALIRGHWRGALHAATLLLKVNQRTHRKLIVVDQCHAIVGSANVSDQFLHWRETSAEVHGKAALELQQCFEEVWPRCHNPAAVDVKTPSFTLITTRRSKARLKSGLVRSNHALRFRLQQRLHLQRTLRKAQKRLWIATAYFIPSPMLLRSLRIAADKGVDVRLILPWQTDVRPARWVAQLFYARLLDAGVKIYEYQPTMMHAKTLLIDDIALVGSTNLNYRSFYHDLEIDLILKHPTTIMTLQAHMEQDIQHSLRVDRAYLQRRSWRNKVAGWLSLWFRHWM